MEVVLRDLALSDEPAFLRAVSAWPPGESLVFAPAYASGMPFADYVALLEAHARGEQLPERWVPSRTMFGFCGALLVGRLQLRLERNDFLLRVGGQIGYAVLPELRGRGCAGSMLRQALAVAAGQYGMRRLLVTCDEDNVASARTIESAGGVLENVMEGKRRYWIELVSEGHR